MATEKTAAAKTTKVAKTPLSLVEKTKLQLNTAALKNKLTVADLTELQNHLTKLVALVG